MSEAERLQKIVAAQEREIKKLRNLLATVRVARIEWSADEKDGILHVSASAIGVDEFNFIDQLKPQLNEIATAILGIRTQAKKEVTDAITGEPIEGAVSV